MADLQSITTVVSSPVREVGLKPDNQATGTSQATEASSVSERNLFEYLAQQAQANSLGASVLANPSAMAGQASRQLRGLMERLSQEAQMGGKKGRSMVSDKEGAQPLNAPQSDEARVHPGPGREQLTPSDGGAKQAGAAVPGISESEYDYIIDFMARSMSLSLEASAVITGSSGVVKSFQTLLRGQ